MFGRKPTRRIQQLERRVAELEADVEARDRQIRILEVERDALAAVVARDRERIKAETAALARRTAEAER